MAKRGRMSDEEKLFLDQNLDGMTDGDLALRLDRTVSFVVNYRKVQPHKLVTEEEDTIIVKLHNLYFWSEIKQQYQEWKDKSISRKRN